MTRIKICKEINCKDAATTKGYCRLHYLKHWKTIRADEKNRSAKRLDCYVEYVYKNNPDNYLDIIKQDIKSEDFDSYIEESFSEKTEAGSLFDDPAYEEDIEKLIDDLKIEKGF